MLTEVGARTRLAGTTENSLSVATVRARFGRPAAEYHVGVDIVMIYRYNLLTRLRGRTFPGPS